MSKAVKIQNKSRRRRQLQDTPAGNVRLVRFDKRVDVQSDVPGKGLHSSTSRLNLSRF